MTPQEKASELIYKMAGYQVRHSNDNGTFPQLERAKQCAIIAANEVINVLCSFVLTDRTEPINEELKAWKEVKQHLNK